MSKFTILAALAATAACIACLLVRPRVTARVPVGPVVYAVAKTPQAIPGTIRTTLQSRPGAGGIVIRLSPGVYRLREPVALQDADCPVPVRIEGAGATFSGSARANGWHPARLADGFTAGMQLAAEQFKGGKRVPLARYPRAGWATVTAAFPDGFTSSVTPPAGRLMVHGYFGQVWSDDRLLVGSVHGNRVTIAGKQSGYGYSKGDRFFFEVLPSAGAAEVSFADSLLVLDRVSNLTVVGVTFTECRGDAVVITGGDHDVLDHCTIANTGDRAAVIQGATYSGLKHCAIHDTGAGGVTIDAGDRQTLTPGADFVEDCTIRDFAVREWCYRPAVDMRGVGNRVVHCDIGGSRHEAIQFSGNDHLIEGNDIHDACLDTGDAGAIYTGRDWSARGTIIRGNYIHDIPSPLGVAEPVACRAIYLDDMASGTTITGNLFVRVHQAVYVNGGRDNDVEGNTFWRSRGVTVADNGGRLSDADKDELIRRLRAVPYQSDAYAKYGPGLSRLLEPSQHCWSPFNCVVPNRMARSMPPVPPVGPRS